jgi:hypothetical protein
VFVAKEEDWFPSTINQGEFVIDPAHRRRDNGNVVTFQEESQELTWLLAGHKA